MLNRSCYTVETKIKHAHFKMFVRKHLSVVKSISRKWGRRYKYLYIDLNAGLGIDPRGDKCSPLILMDESRACGALDFSYFFIDSDKLVFDNLINACADHNILGDAELECVDNLVFSREFCQTHRARGYPRGTYGLVFADPKGPGRNEFNCLVEFSRVFTKLDLLIYIQATNIKRFNKNPLKGFGGKSGFLALDEWMGCVEKKYFYIREPHGQTKFSLLFCSNWPSLSSNMEDLCMYRTDTVEGKYLLEGML